METQQRFALPATLELTRPVQGLKIVTSAQLGRTNLDRERPRVTSAGQAHTRLGREWSLMKLVSSALQENTRLAVELAFATSVFLVHTNQGLACSRRTLAMCAKQERTVLPGHWEIWRMHAEFQGMRLALLVQVLYFKAVTHIWLQTRWTMTSTLWLQQTTTRLGFGSLILDFQGQS